MAEGSEQAPYVVVLDGGSSGTRVHVFSRRGEGLLRVPPETVPYRVDPGGDGRKGCQKMPIVALRNLLVSFFWHSEKSARERHEIFRHGEAWERQLLLRDYIHTVGPVPSSSPSNPTTSRRRSP